MGTEHLKTVTEQVNTMKKLNVTQAAKCLGMSRTTFYEHIDVKRISSQSDENGRKLFDPAELARVYGERFKLDTLKTSSERPETDSTEQQKTVENVQSEHTEQGEQSQNVQVVVLQEQVKSLTEQNTELKQDKERLWNQLEQQTRLLAAPKTEEPIQRPQQEQTEESIASQVVEKPDFAASPTQEGIEIEQDTSVDAQEGISQKRKDTSAPNVPQKKKNASQRQKKGKKKQGFFGGLFGGKK